MQTGSPSSSQHEVLKQLLEQNRELNEQILTSSKKIEKYILWIRVLNILKLILIIIPLAFGFWFVSPYLKQFQSAFSTYGELLGIDNPVLQQATTTSSSENTYNQLDSLMNSKQIQQLLKQQQK